MAVRKCNIHRPAAGPRLGWLAAEHFSRPVHTAAGLSWNLGYNRAPRLRSKSGETWARLQTVLLHAQNGCFQQLDGKDWWKIQKILAYILRPWCSSRSGAASLRAVHFRT